MTVCNFDVEIAKKYGPVEAVIIGILSDSSSTSLIIEGKRWVHINTLINKCPFFSGNTIRRALRRLVAQEKVTRRIYLNAGCYRLVKL